jgi:hypothetical protein
MKLPQPGRPVIVYAIEQTLGVSARYNPGDTTHTERVTPVADQQQICRQRLDAHFNGLPTRWQANGAETLPTCRTGSCT